MTDAWEKSFEKCISVSRMLLTADAGRVVGIFRQISVKGREKSHRFGFVRFYLVDEPRF